MYIQRYIQPNKGRNLIYRLNYYCNPKKYRKPNYVEILGPSDDSMCKIWVYNPLNMTLLYKSYNGISELELTAKKIVYMASLVIIL